MRRDRHVMERDAVPLHEAAQVLVIRNHAGDVEVEVAALPAVQQIVQTMILLAHEYHHPFGPRRVGDLPLHGEVARERGEALREVLAVEWQGLCEHHLAGEEPAAAAIGVVIRFDDPAAMLGEKTGDGGYDADAIRAGERQGEMPLREQVFHHSNRRCRREGFVAECEPTFSHGERHGDHR